MDQDTGIDIPDITDQFESAYVRLLQAIVHPFCAIKAENVIDVITLSDGREAQVRLVIDTNRDRWM